MLNSSEVVIMSTTSSWGEKEDIMEWKQEDITPCTSPNNNNNNTTYLPLSPPAQQVYDSYNVSLSSSSSSSPTHLITSSPSYYNTSLFDDCSFDGNSYGGGNTINNIYLNHSNNSINSSDNGDFKEDPFKYELDTDPDSFITFTETKAQVASKLLDDLDHLEHLDQWIKEEPLPFSDWLEEKIDLPIFGDLTSSSASTNNQLIIPTPVSIQVVPQQEHVQQNVHIKNHFFTLGSTNPKNDFSGVLNVDTTPAVGGVNTASSQEETMTQTLMQEFETVFEQVNMSTTLTPPQSPPQNHQRYATMQPVQIIQPDVAKALAVVDELVRCRAEGLVYSTPTASPWRSLSGCGGGDDDSPLSPSTSESSSTSYGCGDESSSSNTDDPEWIPETINNSDGTTTSTMVLLKHPSKGHLHRTKSSKPYDRSSSSSYPTEDKKSRKKEQNKNAATRYRQKKKAEIAVILSEEKGLQDIHDEFETQVNDLSREIKYLKGLMRDLFKAKGLIK